MLYQKTNDNLFHHKAGLNVHMSIHTFLTVRIACSGRAWVRRACGGIKSWHQTCGESSQDTPVQSHYSIAPGHDSKYARCVIMGKRFPPAPRVPVVVVAHVAVFIHECPTWFASHRFTPWQTYRCRAITDSWTLRKSLRAAAIPAAGYVLQNWLTQCACANLDSLTYNLLNQTKTLFAALCLFLVMGKRQSPMQLVALSLLLGAALILNAGNRDTGGDGTAQDSDDSLQRLWLGILPVLGSAFLSGLFGAVTQRTLQTGYSSFLLSLELAVYGIASLLFTCALGDTCFSGGIQGLFRGWTRWTWVPVLSQAAGGVIVGQVSEQNAMGLVVCVCVFS